MKYTKNLDRSRERKLVSEDGENGERCGILVSWANLYISV